MPQENKDYIPRLDAEKALLHANSNGRRLLVALIAVVVLCLGVVAGFVRTIQCFTEANTERQQIILDTFARMYGTDLTEVDYGTGPGNSP